MTAPEKPTVRAPALTEAPLEHEVALETLKVLKALQSSIQELPAQILASLPPEPEPAPAPPGTVRPLCTISDRPRRHDGTTVPVPPLARDFAASQNASERPQAAESHVNDKPAPDDVLRKILANTEIAVSETRATNQRLVEMDARNERRFSAIEKDVAELKSQVTAGVHVPDLPPNPSLPSIPSIRPQMNTHESFVVLDRKQDAQTTILGDVVKRLDQNPNKSAIIQAALPSPTQPRIPRIPSTNRALSALDSSLSPARRNPGSPAVPLTSRAPSALGSSLYPARRNPESLRLVTLS